jgi:hypothetical protein
VIKSTKDWDSLKFRRRLEIFGSDDSPGTSLINGVSISAHMVFQSLHLGRKDNMMEFASQES